MGENSKKMCSNFVPKTIGDILAQVSAMDDFSKKSSTLDFYVTLLEEESRKIDAFKRELPLCMYLLKEAIERLVEEKLHWRAREMRPVMEEFIPLKREEEGGAKGSFQLHEKKNWMSSAQLWTTPVQYEKTFDPRRTTTTRYEEGEGSGSEKLYQGFNLQNRGGAFVPFKKPCGVAMKEEKKVHHGLSLSIPVKETESVDVDVKEGSGFQLHEPNNHQQQRKQRRCWSPELHAKFVDALQQLGGAQVATPKQIREIMNVEGLTNDEVKSHLQKYRIYVRRVPASSLEAADYSWLAQDEPGKFLKQNSGQSCSPQGPLVHGGLSKKRASGSGGGSMEEGEDDQSENHGWMGRAQKKSA